MDTIELISTDEVRTTNSRVVFNLSDTTTQDWEEMFNALVSKDPGLNGRNVKIIGSQVEADAMVNERPPVRAHLQSAIIRTNKQV